MSGGDVAIQCSKLLEWLLSRRVIPEDYARLLVGVEAKVQQALAEPVADAAAREVIARHKSSVTFFAAREIYEAVAKSAAGQAKSLLGAHTDPAAAKWKAVVDAFRRRKLGWASEARELVQSVSYEIPALKKHAAACERQVSDCTQRQAELTRQEGNAKSRYESLLSELGIDGLDPRSELMSLAAAQLPGIYGEVVAVLLRSGPAWLELYQVFARYASGGAGCDGVLPLMRALLEDGAEAAVEDVERRVPALLELRAARARTEARGGAQEAPELAGGADGISGGDASALDGDGGLHVVGQADGGISWDFVVEEPPEIAAGDAAAPGGDGGIDWGALGPAAAPADGAAGGGIDWSALCVEGLEVHDDGGAGAAAAGSSLLEDASVRELLHQELAEVGAFLRERRAEHAAGAAEGGPADGERTAQELDEMLAAAGEAEELLAGRNTQRLVMFRTSKRYVEQTIKRLDIAKAQCQKPVARRSALDKVKAEQAEEARRAHAEIEALRAATRRKQRDLEAELSGHFKANVAIVGEIAQI